MGFRFVVFLLVFATTLLAGTVEGTVHDPSGAAIPHCTVTLKGVETALAETDAQGLFRLDRKSAV